MSESQFARSFPALAPISAIDWVDSVVTQGHATHTIDGEIQPRCPRCGDEVEVEVEPIRPTIVTPITDSGKALRAAIAHSIETALAVDEIADELISKETNMVDRDNLPFLRIQDVQNAIVALDKIIRGDWEVCLLPAEVPHTQLLAESIDRARQIRAAIDETLASL